ncbi:glycosyltransferase family 2 protein [Salinarimonas rosea]|uniref:glycosyltransferase family 2 protein n=1 Tax=Salinarimonas rosea TaxID=552063 RepID=UPI0004117701|nr:glycosyltransferase family 2 protein [Salinarimonas rosea]
MKISVVTASFNSAATIEETLRSVNSQTHPDIEHIVVDGASRDATMEIVRSLGERVAVAVSEPDRGIYDAMNKGLALATGDVVGFLNSDDVYARDDALALLAAAIERDGTDAAYGDLVFVPEDDTSRVVRYWRSRPYEPGLCARGWMPAHPTFYVRTEMYRRHGVFDLDYRYAADFEICLRLLDVGGVRASYVPQTLVRMRMGGHSTGSVRAIARSNVESARACRKHGLPGGPLFIARKLSRKVPELLRRPREA